MTKLHSAFIGVLMIVGSRGFLEATPQGASTSSPPGASTLTANAASTLGNARTAVLIHEGPPSADADAHLRELRTQLRKWNRFDVIDRADRADVTIALNISQQDSVALGSAAPVAAGLVHPERATVRRNVLTLTVRQRSTGVVLWTGASGTVANGLQRLQQAMPRGPAVCVLFWCR